MKDETAVRELDPLTHRRETHPSLSQELACPLRVEPDAVIDDLDPKL